MHTSSPGTAAPTAPTGAAATSTSPKAQRGVARAPSSEMTSAGHEARSQSPGTQRAA